MQTIFSVFKATTGPYSTNVQLKKVPFPKRAGFHLPESVIINIQSGVSNALGHAAPSGHSGPACAAETSLLTKPVLVKPDVSVKCRFWKNSATKN